MTSWKFSICSFSLVIVWKVLRMMLFRLLFTFVCRIIKCIIGVFLRLLVCGVFEVYFYCGFEWHHVLFVSVFSTWWEHECRTRSILHLYARLHMLRSISMRLRVSCLLSNNEMRCGIVFNDHFWIVFLVFLFHLIKLFSKSTTNFYSWLYVLRRDQFYLWSTSGLWSYGFIIFFDNYCKISVIIFR